MQSLLHKNSFMNRFEASAWLLTWAAATAVAAAALGKRVASVNFGHEGVQWTLGANVLVSSGLYFGGLGVTFYVPFAY
jgi:hypothetical protein